MGVVRPVSVQERGEGTAISRRVRGGIPKTPTRHGGVTLLRGAENLDAIRKGGAEVSPFLLCDVTSLWTFRRAS